MQTSAKNKVKRGAMRYSDWMSELPPALHDIPLFNLAIPGSHDSMSYDLDISSPIAEPKRLKKFSRFYCVRRLMLKWGATQEETIIKQLDAGVRYFDLRVARKPDDANPTRLYFYHGLYTRTDVESILKVINDWAERHPKEVIILALSHFHGFDKRTEELHNHLVNFIKNLFGTKVVQREVTPTLRSCWDQRTNVIVSYDYPAKYHSHLWSKISYFYGDSMDRTKIESELSQVLKNRPSHCFFVCGLNLTLPENIRILKYILRMCDNFANVVRRSLPKLLPWLKQQASKKPNIVASDLATHEGFISTVIQLNAIK
ncbi:PI-PLC X domain-containing protein 1-like [Betta splendens]|uniref:PI-PLC X domain-containing protein 1-like n=1 Tax=Betta splendens TaxID=158456 RepID=A0A6P7L5K8_BETSP|nr:PI-PLC X domain-containing protein 1-like [Betta splendens]